MSYAQSNLNIAGLSTTAVAILGAVGLGVWYLVDQKRKKEEEEEEEAAFHAREERVEMEDFDPLTLITKVGNLMGGDFKVLSAKRLTKAGSVEDDLGETHKYKAKKAWLVGAEIDGDEVLLLVRRNGSVELLEG